MKNSILIVSNNRPKMKMNLSTYTSFLTLILLHIPLASIAQNASISIENRSIETYAFDEPNPLPILAENPKIYPYFKFEGYSQEKTDREWDVVKMENDFITVYILPEIGGKIWGAIEKKTGEEFLYRNEVIKFRNIAMRGPWTSGGVEFNFGIIGHTPATATPVDYEIMENEDGSVSCVVGAMDLPSRTQWRVEIRLDKDKAFYETNASWYNPTSLNQSYYNWMTGAAAASEDLEFFIPGNQSIEHGGDPNPWPIDKDGRKLFNYKDNNFGSHKSYHIVGEYKDYFGGYYHDKEFGFGHWSPYEEMPGQKLWLWALSRSGGIWEDLLTDTDGQYIEFQAGRLFNQYFPEGGNNPITQASFDPYVMDRWREIWFPFVEIGGMEAASEWGVMNVEYEDGMAIIGLNALQTLHEDFMVSINDQEVVSESLSMKPMDVFYKKVKLSPTDKLEVKVGDHKIYYTNDTDRMKLKRPFYSESRNSLTADQKLYFEGWEAMKYREYGKARQDFATLLKTIPYHQDALVKMAELEFKRANYDEALAFANRVLELDTYHPEANYKAGIIYRAKKDYINALETFGWAARSMGFRSVSFAQMAEIYVALEEFDKATDYARKALDFNKYNINARNVLIVCARKFKDEKTHQAQIKKVLEYDPLNHFAQFESHENLKVSNEFPAESSLELALQYFHLGLMSDAIHVLSLQHQNTKNSLWLAYLLGDVDPEKSAEKLIQALEGKIDFTFPYRRESIEVFEWVKDQSENWKSDYYLALNYYAVGKNELGDQLMQACENIPDSPVFYRFRGQMLKNGSIDARIGDYDSALALEGNDWKQREEHIQLLLEAGELEKAKLMSEKTYQMFPKNYNTGLIYAKSLLSSKEYERSIEVLQNIVVLPSELARSSRHTYYRAHVFLAEELIGNEKYDKAIQILERSKLWPENLGVGKPYIVDERLQDYLIGLSYEKLGKKDKADSSYKRIVSLSEKEATTKIYQVLKLLALQKLANKEVLQSTLAKLEMSESKDDQLTLAIFNSSVTNNEEDMVALLERIVGY
ncbi:DUF5107 domain-containing protein [Portibacter lacus]|uniref:DUF5107 domain-containing protein n=1 Tax=Portibacter lacus TaxID=1099794 RepID=A0AA37SJT7_9BACT|nr:DUF5107 domain-containing protein [Portibacter lacus]GLR15856.1 hypothetical protein GCM10007940_04710 [Portibacter lacus]